MFNIQKHLRHAVLALGLATASLTAAAGVLPTYHISVSDTVTKDVAAIDFLFGGLGSDVPAVTASLSHFAGTPLTELDREGAVSGTSDAFAIANTDAFNELFLEVDGPFAFDLNFSEGFLGIDNLLTGSLFSIALYDSSGALIEDPNGSLNLSLSATGVNVTSTSSLLSLTEVTAGAVPEPTDWMLMLTGLVFVVCMTRRNGRANVRSLAAAQA